MKSTLLIIDAMNLIRRIYAVQDKQHGESPAALLATESTACNALKKLLKIHQPTHVICVFDSHTPSWRHQVSAEYIHLLNTPYTSFWVHCWHRS